MKGGDTMPIDFFTTELHKIQDRFNQTFGKLATCNVNTRMRVMLSIISLSFLERKIMAEKERDDIKRFIRTRDVLNKFFDQFKEVKNVERTNKRKTGGSTKALRDRRHTFAG